MKLIGFREVKGEKDGRKWDFFQLVIDREESNTDHSGGVQLLMRNRNGNYSLPSVSPDVWNNALKNGVRIGSSVKLFWDADNNVIFEKDISPFEDVV